MTLGRYLLAVPILLCAALLAWRMWPSAPFEPRLSELAWWNFDEGSGALVRDSVSGLSAPLPAVRARR